MRQTLAVMFVAREVEDFVRIHRSCGVMRGDAGTPTAEGYFLWVACECGERFERWVTPEAAEEEVEGWARHLRN